MSYCSGFSSPSECSKRSLFLVFISFTAIYLILYFCPYDLAALPKSGNLPMESEKSLLRKIFPNFKQILGKENGELPRENEKSGNKAAPTLPQPFAFIVNEEEKCKDRTPFLVLLIATAAGELQHRNATRRSWGREAAVAGADVLWLFVLGSDTAGDNGDVLLRESEQCHDIIQQDLLDTYNNS